MTILTETDTTGVALIDSATAAAIFTVAATDKVRIGKATGDATGWAPFFGIIGACTDNLVARTSLTAQWQLGVSISDALSIKSRLDVAAIYNLSLAVRVAIGAAIRRQLRVSALSGIAVGSNLTVSLAMKLRERVAISAALGVQGILSAALNDGVLFHDKTLNALLGTLHDALKIGDGTSYLTRLLLTMQDTIELTDGLSPLLRIVGAEQDGIEIDESMSVAAIYNVLLTDGIDFAMDVVDPGGGMTAWAMNARSGGITEYGNWPFNSYARLDDRYIAADSTGLYELLGDRDQLDPIISRIMPGLLEMAGSHLTGFKAAYVAIRGDGDLFLRLEGGGKTVTYKAVAHSLRTRRVDLGKGWRARYVQWELITTGQDFDLTGLQFLPITSTRRVQ